MSCGGTLPSNGSQRYSLFLWDVANEGWQGILGGDQGDAVGRTCLNWFVGGVNGVVSLNALIAFQAGSSVDSGFRFRSLLLSPR